MRENERMLQRLRRLFFGEQAPNANFSRPAPIVPATRGQAPPVERAWPNEALGQLAFSIHGIRLGCTRAEAAAILGDGFREVTDVCWRWGAHDMSSVLFDGDRVSEIWGTSLEKDGRIILKQGDSTAALSALGDNSRAFNGSTEMHIIWCQPHSLLDVTVTNESARGSEEHREILQSNEVVDKVFHIGLKLEED